MSITEMILAVFAPFFMVLFMSRVTYNVYVSALLSLGIITTIHIKYNEPSYVIIFWGISLTVGFMCSKPMVDKLKKR